MKADNDLCLRGFAKNYARIRIIRTKMKRKTFLYFPVRFLLFRLFKVRLRSFIQSGKDGENLSGWKHDVTSVFF